jgi:ubiquinone/menaquinone biosynthesis C-methylase UbiE
MWEFNKDVADGFPIHARQHIPNYIEVISQCLDICNSYKKNSKIIDVGCATGETLNSLKSAGFTNLHGVDNSPFMLEKCNNEEFTLTCSSSLPNEMYDIILMNWTLHFVKEKIEYLKEIYTRLDNNGVFVLSEKTSNDDLPIKFYHLYKSRMGVSAKDIAAKANSVKNVMFINDIQWYLNTLKEIGFNKVYIINAYWCFTTFVCLK